ncbi:Methionine-R-Sulfoxide Reductase B3 [Manis pentadactyla]|nr:Methionine-R-Sulfoxide Reductase B3 [Manis pentadactyla]
MLPSVYIVLRRGESDNIPLPRTDVGTHPRRLEVVEKRRPSLFFEFYTELFQGKLYGQKLPFLPYWFRTLLPLFFASGFVGEAITVMSAFNLLHLVTKSQPVALRACGLPSGSCRDKKNCKVVFSQQELRKRLTPLQYHVTQEKGTESAFEGEYTHHKDPGIYKCVVCGTPLFKYLEVTDEE